MPRVEGEAWEIACAESKRADGTFDEQRRTEVFEAEYERRIAERKRRLTGDTRAVWRAMDGWARVETPEQWLEMVATADDEILTGKFLIDRLGADRHLDPEMMAALLVLRRGLIDEYGAEGAAEFMLIDVAVISYYHTLRINGWIGNVSTKLEGEFFGTKGLDVVIDGERRSAWQAKIKGLRVIELAERLGEQLMPLLDRSNRMMLRNLKALHGRRHVPPPSVTIGSAGQVNVAAAQQNSAVSGSSGDDDLGRPQVQAASKDHV